MKFILIIPVLAVLIWLFLRYRALRATQPSGTAVDISGVLLQRFAGGWLVNTPSRRVAVTCTHSNPSIPMDVWFVDNGVRYTYAVVKVLPLNISVDGSPIGSPNESNFFNGDVTVLVLGQQVDRKFTAYDYASGVSTGAQVDVVNQQKGIVSGKFVFNGSGVMATLSNATGHFAAGDSGMPWFDQHNRVIGHTVFGDRGFGCIYSSARMFNKLNELIAQAELSAQQTP